LETGEPRFWPAWFFLALLFVLVLGQALSEAFSRPASPERTFTQENQLLKMTFNQETVLQQLRSMSGSSAAMGPSASTNLDGTVSRLLDLNKTEPMAAKLYAAMRREQRRPVPPEELAILTKSKESLDRRFAEIYLAKDLSKQRAEELTKGFPDRPFVYVAARAHAFQTAGDFSVRESVSSPLMFVGMMLLSMAMIVLVPTSLALWILYSAKRRKGEWAPKGHPLEPISLYTADALAMRAAQVFALFFVVQLSVAFTLRGVPRGVALGAMALTTVIAVIVLFRTQVAGRKITLRDVGISRENLGANIFWGIGTWIASLPFLAMAVLIAQALMPFFPEPSHPVNQMMAGGAGPLLLFGIFLAASVSAPFWEEIMFRGLMTPALARLFGSRFTAIGISSFAFAAIHPQGVVLWLALGTIAVFCSLVTYQTRSLVPAIAMHALHNTVILTIGLLMM
jgi:membrane protease YdiL (CAAX protease family)